jgi:hypothetical protein
MNESALELTLGPATCAMRIQDTPAPLIHGGYVGSGEEVEEADFEDEHVRYICFHSYSFFFTISSRFRFS